MLRPPLLYGPGAPGNFARLPRLVAAGRPLPLASLANRRSPLFVGNLAGAVEAALAASAAPATPLPLARQRVGEGRSRSVRLTSGGTRFLKNTKPQKNKKK